VCVRSKKLPARNCPENLTEKFGSGWSLRAFEKVTAMFRALASFLAEANVKELNSFPRRLSNNG
jgi:hypothetical protein